MGAITSLQGDALLDPKTITEIQEQVRSIQKNKDVAGAWAASRHLKNQIASLPKDKVASVLDTYRAITAKLKVVALSLLAKEDIVSLLNNNGQFLNEFDLKQLDGSLAAWLALQDEADAQEAKKEFQEIAQKKNISLPNLVSKASAPVQKQQSKKQPSVAPIKPDPEFFDEDEQKEVSEHSTKASSLESAPLDTSPSGTVAQKIAELVQTKDPEMFQRRAAALVRSRLRDVRTPAQIRDYFTRPLAVGGLGLTPDQANSASRLVEEAYQSLHVAAQKQPAPTPVPEPTPQQPAPTPKKSVVQGKSNTVPASVAPPKKKKVAIQQEKQPVQAKEKPVQGKKDLADEIDALIHSEVQAIPPVPAPKQQSTPKKIPVHTPAPAPKTAQKPQPKKPDTPLSRPSITRPKSTNGKPRLDDIVQGSVQQKPPAQKKNGTPVGQADELKFLTLEDFRMHGKPEDAVAYIVQRISLLGEESMEDKQQGIQQFRNSELFTEYLQIGKQSLSGGSNLASVLQNKDLNPHTMTEDEFFAIASLNSKLK